MNNSKKPRRVSHLFTDEGEGILRVQEGEHPSQAHLVLIDIINGNRATYTPEQLVKHLKSLLRKFDTKQGKE